MDTALSPFSPKSLYQRLAQAVQEQEQVCQALEESFWRAREGWGEGGRRVLKRYREARKHGVEAERKERWDEGRVGMAMMTIWGDSDCLATFCTRFTCWRGEKRWMRRYGVERHRHF
jgi:hypothetical protein